MKQLRSLTEKEFELAFQRLSNPAPGSKIEEAKAFGIDVTLLMSQLRISPAERVRRMQEAAETVERVRGAARLAKK